MQTSFGHHSNIIETLFRHQPKAIIKQKQWQEYQNDSKTTFRHRADIIQTSLRYHVDSLKVTTTAK